MDLWVGAGAGNNRNCLPKASLICTTNGIVIDTISYGASLGIKS